MPMRTRTATAAVVALVVATGASHAQLQIVVLEGDAPPGAEGGVIASMNAPFTSGLGLLGFTGSLALDEGGTDNFVFFDTGIVWRNSDAVTATLTGAEGTMGISDLGQFIYSPSIDGEDGVWSDLGYLLRGDDPATGIPGQFVTFCSRPQMSPNGTSHWVSGLSPIAGGSTQGRVLYAGVGTLFTPLVQSGDIVDGFTVGSSGIGFDYDFSSDNDHAILTLQFDTGSSTDDDAIVVDGAVVAREAQPSGDGDNWDNFDCVSVNDTVRYAFSGDTDGAAASDEFIAVDGTIVLREGDTLAGRVLGGSVNALSINDLNACVFIWTTDLGETLFVGSLDDLPGTSVPIAQVGDVIDGNYQITDFNASNIVGPGLSLANDGSVFVEVDVDDLNSGDNLEAIIRAPLLPEVPGTPLLPGQGVQFHQVDYAYEAAPYPDSNHGFFTIDFQIIEDAVGAPGGYVNVFTDMGWVVRNMPVLSDWDKPGMGTMFNLLQPGDQFDVPFIEAGVLHTPDILVNPVPLGFADFDVQPLVINAEGRNAPVPYTYGLLPWNSLVFDPTAILLLLLQGNHPSVEQDDNQCGPGAVANSFEWLKREYGLPIPHRNTPGIERMPRNSRVGQLDNHMGRTQGMRVNDNPAITGKLEYIDDNDLADDLEVKHYNRAGATFVNGDQTVGDATSEDQSGTKDSIADWIKQEIEAGEDVELAIPGHWVEVAAAGEIGGECFLVFVHDAMQGYDDDTGTTAMNGGNTAFDGGVVFTPIKNGRMTGYNDALLDLAFSQSPTCEGDIDGDGEVGFDDLLVVLSEWGPCPGCDGDLDGDDEVGFSDLLVVLSNWGPCH